MNSEYAIAQNLQDAGCGSECIKHFLHAFREQKTAEQMRILLKQRSQLLGEVHAAQKRLDCLDYLMYQIRKEHKL